MSRCLILRDLEHGLEVTWMVDRTLADVVRTTDFAEDHPPLVHRVALQVPPTLQGFYDVATRLLDLLADGLPPDSL